MPRVSPTLEGFRASFRRPSLTLAEITWRWTVGAVGWALIFFWLIEFLDTLPVTRGDAALLSTRHPLLVGRALSHILRGSLNRAVLAALLAAVALALLWIITASIGRAATVRALLEYFRGGTAAGVSTEADIASEARPFHSLTGLNFLRAAVMLAAILAFVGAAILAGFVSPNSNPRPGLVFIFFLPLAGLICIAWPALNWLLSLACVFAVRDGEDTLGALSAAVTFFGERPRPVFAVSTWTGLAHLVAFSVATTLVSLPLAFIQIAPWRLVIIVVFLVTLAYFAIVDWLYMARLAGYVCIAEMPDTPVSSTPTPIPPSPAPDRTTIDRDETILSDVPNLPVEA
ncbi:MAG: hypothetical protein WB683_20215 [Candidatus Sulfotelmatobacter sp.]